MLKMMGIRYRNCAVDLLYWMAILLYSRSYQLVTDVFAKPSKRPQNHKINILHCCLTKRKLIASANCDGSSNKHVNMSKLI